MGLDMDFDGSLSNRIAPDRLKRCRQQITFCLEELARLESRLPSCNDHSCEEALEKERAHIDRLDSELIEILMCRMR